MTTKKKWNPTRVLAHVDSVLAANANLHMQLNAANRLVATNADAVNHWKAAHSEAVEAARANGDRAVEFANQRDRHEVEIRALKAQLRAADETAGKALADAKRARDGSRKSEIYVLQREMVGAGVVFHAFADREAALKHVHANKWLKIKERNQHCWDALDGDGNLQHRFHGFEYKLPV